MKILSVLVATAWLLVFSIGITAQTMNSIIVTVKAQTAHYRLMLQVDPPEEKMYSEAEAAKLHPTSGEILVTSLERCQWRRMPCQTHDILKCTCTLESMER